MKLKKIGPNGRVVSFIDIGTNSVRLLVVRLNPNHSYTILTRQKQQVRLGEGEFDEEEIQPEAIERLVVVCKKFTDLARTFSTEEFVAVATSAMREAANQNEILHLLRQEAQIDVRVISGQEEARLIYLGVASGIHIEDRQVFFIDIGGGSTEIAVGGDRTYQYLESFRLGALRLSNLYFPRENTGPVSSDQYKRVQHHVKDTIIHSVRKIRDMKPVMAVGSSGSIMNLADIAQKAIHQDGSNGDPVLSGKDLQKVIDLLCSLPLDQRRKIPGMNPERADIIIAGAAILDTFMKELGLDSIQTTGRGLQMVFSWIISREWTFFPCWESCHRVSAVCSSSAGPAGLMKCMRGPLQVSFSNFLILQKNRACIISVTMNANFLNMLHSFMISVRLFPTRTTMPIPIIS